MDLGEEIRFRTEAVNMKRIITRNEYPIIAELIKNYTLKEIGDKYGVSRERIRQILFTMGIKATKRNFEEICNTPKCGKKIIFQLKSKKRFCTTCQQYKNMHKKNPEKAIYRRAFEMGICEKCKERRMKARGLCGNCFTKAYYWSNPKYREVSRQKSKERYIKNPEYFAEYYSKNKERVNASGKAWRDRNKEKMKEYWRNKYLAKKLQKSI